MKLAFLQRDGHLPFYLIQRGLFTPKEAAQLLGTDEFEEWEFIEGCEPAEAPGDPMLLQQGLESRHYLANQLLKGGDVFGMAHSVEIRVPFLDHVLAETVLKIPRPLRFDGHWPKPLLIRALRDLLGLYGICFRSKWCSVLSKVLLSLYRPGCVQVGIYGKGHQPSSMPTPPRTYGERLGQVMFIGLVLGH
jgi:hypothetical protein